MGYVRCTYECTTMYIVHALGNIPRRIPVVQCALGNIPRRIPVVQCATLHRPHFMFALKGGRRSYNIFNCSCSARENYSLGWIDFRLFRKF